jgi:CAAX protease family protein
MEPKPTGSLITFFVLTFAVMWACFVPVALAVPPNTPLGTLLILLGTFAPSLVALSLTSQSEGRAGVRRLLLRTVKWRVSAWWYFFAVGYIPAIKLTVALIHRALTGAWPLFGNFPWYLIPFAITISTPVQAGEEIGWRGFALPRLAARFGLARASIVLGIIWACWHLPQFFIAQADTYGQSFFVYLIQVTALSVAMAWLYACTNGSLLLVMLLHASVNNAKDIVPSALPGAANTFGLSASLVAWITILLLWICGAYFLVRMPKQIDE